MYVDVLRVNEGAVAFLRILLRRVPEETAEDCLLHFTCALTARYHVQLVSGNNEGERRALGVPTWLNAPICNF